MEILSFQPENRNYRKKFIRLPFEIYRNDPNWVPPLANDVRSIFNKKQHGFYQHGDVNFLIAMDGPHAIGRLVMLQNFNDSSRTAHFFLFEAQNNFSIAQKLFEKGVAWARERNLKKIYGPKGMTPMSGLGLLVRGFNLLPAFGMPYNPGYYPEFFRTFGFTQVDESESGIFRTDAINLPIKIRKAAELVRQRKGFYTLRISNKKELRKAISKFGVMYNATLAGDETGIPLTEADLDTIASGLLWIAQPELVKIIMKGDQAIGFLLTYPDVSKALQQTQGRIFPFGWIRILWEKSHSKRVNINGIGVIEKYRGMAGTAVLFSELYDSVTSSDQFTHAEVIQIGLENERMRHELREIGIDFNKTHAMFELDIS